MQHRRISMPSISIIIPHYNMGQYIKRTLDSVLKQTIQDFEVIVVDGNSTDNGPDIVRQYGDKRIRLVMQEGKGVSQARNQGVGLAQADLIAFLDADDEWMPLHLRTILRLRENYPEAGIFTTAYKIQMREAPARLAYYKHVPKPPWEGLLPNYFKSLALGDYPFITSVSAIPKKIFLEAGGFPLECWWGEDLDLFTRIALKYPVAFSWEQGGIYHCDASNRASSKITPYDREEPFVITVRDAMNRGEVSSDFILPLNECIYQRELWRAAQNLLNGNKEIALSILKQCKTKWFLKIKVKWYILAKLPYPMPNLYIIIEKRIKRIIKY